MAPGRFAEAIARLKLTTTLSASVPAQAALADYLQHGGYDRHLRRLRHALEGQQASLRQALARHFPPGLRVSHPAGGYFLWVELAPGLDALALLERALAQGISLAPGPMFSARRAYRNCVRLNYGHPWGPPLEDAVQRLGALVRGVAPVG